MPKLPTDKKSGGLKRSRGIGSILVAAGFHTLAVLILGAASTAFFSSEITLNALRWAWAHEGIFSSVGVGLAGHLGLCALTWATLVFSASRLRRLWNASNRDASTPLKLSSKTTGSVLTETLIVLPVALVLIMGIGQLALINIATTLADLAVIQSARSAWVWLPEATEGRFNVDRSIVAEKARVQAAAVLAPTAPADYGYFQLGAHSDYTRTFQKTMGAIYGAQLEGGGGNDVGAFSQTQAEQKLSSGVSAVPKEFSFYRAFDSETFQDRSARKFYNSWAYTDVKVAEEGNRVGVEMTYNYFCLMPLVAGIFGEKKQINGKDGFFLTITRKYTLRKQVKVNAEPPRR